MTKRAAERRRHEAIAIGPVHKPEVSDCATVDVQSSAGNCLREIACQKRHAIDQIIDGGSFFCGTYIFMDSFKTTMASSPNSASRLKSSGDSALSEARARR